MNTSTFRPTLGALLLLALPVHGATLFSDNFDSVTSGADINGRAPTVNNLNGSTWVASTSTFLGDGAGGLNADSSDGWLASLDLGAGFLAANAGVYELSLDITQPTVMTPGSSWLALGFSSGSNTEDNLVGNNGQPWMLFRINGNANVYAGPGVANTLLTGYAVTTGTAHTFKLQLDTTATLWTLDAFVDGVALDLNGGSVGTTYTYSTNPTAAQYVAMSTGSNGERIGTVDNFSLTGPVPEPGAAVMLLGGLGMLGLLRRRRS